MEHYGDATAQKLNNENITTISKTSIIGSGDTKFVPDFLTKEEADDAFQSLFNGEINYQQWHHMPNKKNELLPLSRLKIAMADTNNNVIPHYRFPVNNQNHHGVYPFSKTVKFILGKLIAQTGINFNHSVVLLYRDGNDCIGFHKDKTLDLSPNDPIVSISLGQDRSYVLRDNIFNPKSSQEIILSHGGALFLGPKTNENWFHSIPVNKEQKLQPRISITFRVVTTFRNVITNELFGQGQEKQILNWPIGDHMVYHENLLDFWFGKDYDYRSGLWWRGVHPTNKNLQTLEQCDKYMSENWSHLLEKYTSYNIDLFNDNHYLKSWMNSDSGMVALMILFDQFSRNIYRGGGKSFSFDNYALVLANYLWTKPDLILPFKFFVLVVQMHSENINIVNDAITEFAKLSLLENISYKWKKGLTRTTRVCKEHLEVLKQFGRYPHRNLLLGRESTREELNFLLKKDLPKWAMTSKEEKVGKLEKLENSKKLNILVLHSNKQSAASFKNKTKIHLESKLKDIANLTYCNAPNFYKPAGEIKGIIKENEYDKLPNNNEYMRTWWNASDDPTTMVYNGLEDSIEYVNDMFKNNNYDGIIGFSQGGALASILAALVNDKNKRVNNISNGLKFVVIISGFYCRDIRDEFTKCFLENVPKIHLKEHINIRKELIKVPSFHVWGLADELVDPWRSEVLANAFENKIVKTHLSSHFAKAIKYWPIDDLVIWLKSFTVSENNIYENACDKLLFCETINVSVLNDFKNNITDLLEHIIENKKCNSGKLVDILVYVFDDNSEKIYDFVNSLVVKNPKLLEKLFEVDNENKNDNLRKILVKITCENLKSDYQKYVVNKEKGFPSRMVEFAPRNNSMNKKNGIHLDITTYMATIINVSDSSKNCLDFDHEKKQKIVSYNQYRKIASELTKLLPPKYVPNFKKHLPKTTLEQQLKVPISDHIVNPQPEPFDISPPNLMEPLYKFLQDKNNVLEFEKEFERGTICTDGRLDLCKQMIGPSGINGLIKSLEIDSSLDFPKVKHLLLGNNMCGNELGSAIGEFIKSGKSTLTTWYVAGNKLNEIGIKPICDALCNDNCVKQLWLKRNPIHKSGVVHIVNMLKNNNYLRVLDLTNTGLFDDGAELLLKNMCGNLEYLYLSSNGLTENTCKVIYEELPKRNLKQIAIGCNRIKDAGAEWIAKLLEHPNCKLSDLEIASCGISEVGAKKIADALKVNKSLISLNFGFLKSTIDLNEVPNNIGSTGGICLAESLKINTTLRSLDLIYTGILQDAVKAFANMLSSNTTLVKLNVEQFGVPHNELSREVIRHSIIRNRNNTDKSELCEIEKIINPPHLEEIKSVYRIS